MMMMHLMRDPEQVFSSCPGGGLSFFLSLVHLLDSTLPPSPPSMIQVSC